LRTASSRIACGLAVALMAASAGSALAAAAPALVTVTTGGVSANETTPQDGISVSADGTLVAFASGSSNLVAGDTNGVRDVFVRNLVTGTTTRVTLGAGGQANGASSNARISADGRFVVFTSLAANLVAGDTNGVADVFERDLATGQTTRVSISAGGIQGNDASGGAASGISADGATISFSSAASNLIAGDTNHSRDVFVWTRASGAVERASVAGDGSQAAAGASDASSISADGRYVAFASSAPNLVAGDTNLAADVFVHDRVTGSTVRASVTASGGQAATASSLQPGGLAANGQAVAFDTAAPLAAADTGRNDVYLRDLAAGTTERISVNSAGLAANGNSGAAAISADGRYVAFESSATNLDPADTGGDEDVFVRDRVSGLSRLVSASASPIQVSQAAAISADARFVALATTAADMVAGDTAVGFGTGWDVVRLASPFDPPADRAAPVVTCAAADGAWHPDNVALWCTASDAGSGLANAGQAAFALATSVPAGSETADAVTGAVQVCDRAGNCATAGPISGIRVDRRAPQITIAAPLDGGEIVLGATRKASFTCSDGGSGVAGCIGTVANGAALDTATPGTHSFTVTATDAVGNHATETATYAVRFAWLGWEPPLSGDRPNAAQAGRTIPVRFAVGGAGRANAIAGVRVAPVACGGSSAVAAGDPSLTAADWSVPGNHRGGSSMLLWRTTKTFDGSCRQLLVQLTDGSVHRLTFNFR
jgi:Tol biopolymer transport system component